MEHLQKTLNCHRQTQSPAGNGIIGQVTQKKQRHLKVNTIYVCQTLKGVSIHDASALSRISLTFDFLLASINGFVLVGSSSFGGNNY